MIREKMSPTGIKIQRDGKKIRTITESRAQNHVKPLPGRITVSTTTGESNAISPMLPASVIEIFQSPKIQPKRTKKYKVVDRVTNPIRIRLHNTESGVSGIRGRGTPSFGIRTIRLRVIIWCCLSLPYSEVNNPGHPQPTRVAAGSWLPGIGVAFAMAGERRETKFRRASDEYAGCSRSALISLLCSPFQSRKCPGDVRH